MSDGPILELRNVSTHYGLIAVLREVNLEIHPGEIVCLLGGNASGKSTTLRTILGMVTPSEGEVLYEGRPIGGLPTMEIVSQVLTMGRQPRCTLLPFTVLVSSVVGLPLALPPSRQTI